MSVETAAQHHKYSASGASGWLNCHGKLVMEKGIPARGSSYADEGSAAHFLASECLLSGKNPEDYLGKSIICWERPDGHSGQSFYGDTIPLDAVEGSIWKVNSEMTEHISAYCDYVRGVAKGGTLQIEQQVEFGSLIGIPGAFGTSDTIILSADGTELIVVDLKYGRKEVSSLDNPQMQLYALGAMNNTAKETVEIPHPYQQLEDTVMAHRYLYYIECAPIMLDVDFDKLERNARSSLKDKLDSPVHSNGSELADSYSDKVVKIALKWAKERPVVALEDLI
jgi:hypothetical protein